MTNLADELERLALKDGFCVFALRAFVDDNLPAILSALRAKPEGEPVARIVSAHGDPEAFGERRLEALKDLQGYPYNTPLYTRPTA